MDNTANDAEMNNPWLALPLQPPFVLGTDKEQVEAFNRSAKPAYRLRTDLLPEPYLGDPANASIILLNLNPGYSPNDHVFYSDSGRSQACLNNLAHAAADYPFYLLDPCYREFSGPNWWYQKLRRLIESTSLKQVAKRVCCMEFFPYHSVKFDVGRLRLASQAYSFRLVREAIAAKKLILIMRARRHWERAIPELKGYPCYTLKSSQRAWITANNINNDGFEKLMEALTVS